MTTMKLCKDCKWHRKVSTLLWKADLCYNHAHGHSPINGEPLISSCQSARKDTGACGQLGGLWEPKQNG